MTPEQPGQDQESTFTNPVAGVEAGSAAAAPEAKDPASAKPRRAGRGRSLLAGAAALLAGIGGAKAVANEQSAERPEGPAPITAAPSPEATATTAPAEGQTVTFESAPPGMPAMTGEVQAAQPQASSAENSGSQGASLGGLEGVQIQQGESEAKPAQPEHQADLGGLEGTQIDEGESEPHPAGQEKEADLGGLEGTQIDEGESQPHPAGQGEANHVDPAPKG